MRRRRKIYIIFFAAVFLLFAILSSLSPRVWFVNPQKNYHRTFWREYHGILERESIATLLTFDEPSLPKYSDDKTEEERFDLNDHAACGTVKTKGKHGYGLKFDGDNDTFYASSFAWQRIPDSFTIAFWIKLHPLPISQDIFCSWGHRQMGLRLDRGRLSFDWTTTNSVESISYEFEKYKEFVHIAVIADRKNGNISLYENGVRMAHGDFKDFISFRWQFTLGKGNFERNREPLHGTIDDFAAWNRAISEDELRRIVASPYGLLEHLCSSKTRFTLKKKQIRANLAEKTGGFLSNIVTDIPKLAVGLGDAGKIRHVSINMRDTSSRNIARAHAKSTRSECLTSTALVEAFATIDGKTTECRLSLAGGTLYYPYRDRPAYSLEPADAAETFTSGYRRIELLPPEKSGWLIPLAVSEIRKACDFGEACRKDCEPVRLKVNGIERGTYLMRDVSRMQVSQDAQADIQHYRGPNQPFIQRDAEVEYYSPRTLDGGTSNLVYMLKEAHRESVISNIAKYADILSGDFRSPVPSVFRESAIRGQMALLKETIYKCEQPDLCDITISTALFLGSNTCAWRVTDNLDFTRLTELLPDGITASFESSNTNLISTSGEVTRPDSSPELVTVTATLSNNSGTTRSIPLEFRVLPFKKTIPAVFVWTPIPLGRTHRVNATIEIYDCNGTYTRSRFFDDYAKIRYRGNTSFLGVKKLVNIRAGSPHHWFGETETTHLLAVNAYTDIIRVWNRLAYDVFRAFPRENSAPNISPHVKTAELFLNGKYWSLIEFAERPDEHLWKNPDFIAFRHRIASPRTPFMQQKHPDIANADTMDTYIDFEKRLSSFDGSEAQLDKIKSQLDMTSVVDYMILFSLFANINGEENDFWMQEYLMYDRTARKFFYIPWDFDVRMFRWPNLLETELNRLLSKADIGYNDFVLKRWRELRKTVLSKESLKARYDEITSEHAEYLIFEYKIWYPENKDWFDVPATIRHGWEKLVYRLEKLDTLFAERCEQTSGK